MQKTCIFLLLLISLLIPLAACSTTDTSGTGTPTVPDTNSSQDSPRTEVEVPPTATSLPPTWTPMPVEQSGHLSGSDGSDSVTYSGTRVIHVVQYGDTLAKISNRYGAPIAEVARINNIRDWDVIEVGQALTIPIPNE